MALSREFAVRRSVIEACLEMDRRGVNQGTSGNVSVRFANGLLITPSGLPYEEMEPDDIVFMTMEGAYEHELPASSEWRMHRDILRARPEANAVLHAHPIYCTAFAICGLEIPAAHYMIAAAGGPTIRCAPYASYGGPELAAAAVAALEDRACALLANHGLVAIGADLAQAQWRALEIETLAKQYAVALQIGTPRLLADDEIAKTVERFKDYGLRRKPRAA